MISWRYSLKVLLTGALLGLGCGVALADAAPPPSIYFWNSGGSTEEFVRAPAKWGNGEFRTSRQVRFDMQESLQVTTKGLREGLRFDLKKPIDLAPYMTGNGYLRLRVQFHTDRRNDRDGMPGMPGDPVPQGPPRETTKIDHLQLTLMLENGIMSTVIDIPKRRGSEDQVNTRAARADNNGWILFVVPMKSLQATPGASGNLKRVLLTSDNKDTFYLSQLALVNSSDKMSVSIRRQSDPFGTQQGEITVKPGRLTLVADVEAGDGDPLITWNFDADNNNRQPVNQYQQQFPGVDPGMNPDMPFDGQPIPAGPPVDARGLVATHTFPNQEQNYRVEVTVHDRSGKNPDIKTSILVRVRNGS